ncbi:MAG: nickel pincer cofactor biosynthesis protein LarC [Abditibacteriota bacterium]|nr:nickel pincer cofactor biosynthesis protein LarC [Abditibacteriota bacterium]
MKVLYLDCGMGAAGDMLTAALSELLSDRDSFVDKMNSLGIHGVEFALEKSVKMGITGTHAVVTVHGHEEHEHHHHHHHHSPPADIAHRRGHMDLPEDVKADVKAVYDLIAEAESAAHGVPVSEIHFHEVGTADALADIAAVCLLMKEIAPDKVVASPIHVGSGTAKCAHGVLPVPAPATAYILKGVPASGGGIDGELCTPTGAALIKHFAHSFGSMPLMRAEKIGYGMGTKDFERVNCLRAVLGTAEDMAETVTEIRCNIDDMTGEETGFACEILMEAGARDVFTTPIIMKKSRPGVLLTVICETADAPKFAELIFKHTTTLGLRESVVSRRCLRREIEEGSVRVKKGAARDKFEYEDLAKFAREKNISLFEARRMLEK